MTRSSHQQSNPYDELAELFLTDPDQQSLNDQPLEPGSAVASKVRLSLVGHLPVRAGVWMSPYADAAARHAGPTAMLRFDGPMASIELLRAEPSLVARLDGEDLRATIEVLAGSVRQWLIRPDVGEGIDQLDTRLCDDVHVLTGADEAAVVAAYQMVKQLVDSSEQGGRRVPDIAAAVLGASPEAAERMVDRLNRTARSFLGVRIPLALCVPCMEHTIESTGFLRFENKTIPPLGEVINWIRRAERTHKAIGEESAAVDRSRERRQISPDPQAHAPRNEFITALEAELASSGGRSSDDRPDESAVAADDSASDPGEMTGRTGPRESPSPSTAQMQEAAGSSRAASSPDEWAPARTAGTSQSRASSAGSSMPPRGHARLTPKPKVTVECKSPERSAEPTEGGQALPLADQVAGLTALPVRCPGHERVELAADSSGRVHLLMRDPDLRDAHVVSRWVRTHQELLALACREHGLTFDRPPTIHVVTDRPDRVADLHGSDLHLHVVAPVDVEAGRRWYAAALNQPQAAYG